jgi:hypothetical protein
MNWIHSVSYFFGGAFLDKCSSAFCERRDGAALSKPLCKTARRRAFLLYRECAVGILQSVVGYLLVCALETLICDR